MAESSDINGKIGLDVTNFKTGISELNRQIKVIDSGFRAAAAGLGSWGESADGLKTRITSLNQIIDIQKKKIESLGSEYKKIAAEKGADSKAAQDMQIRINKETEALNKNENELKQTKTALNNFGKETDQASEKTGKFSGVLGKMGGALGKAGAAVGKAAITGIAAIGTAAAGAAVGAFKLASDVGKAADELITLSNKTGISTKQLQEMQYAARFIDVDLEVMTGSMAKLTKSMDAARNGTKLSEEAFKKLGVEYKNQDGSLRDSKTVWTETIDALGKVANETDRDALAMQIFGKSAMELNPLIKAGSEELNRLGVEANAVGAVLGDDAVKQAGKFDDMMQTLQASAKGLASNIGVTVMPAISEVVGSVTKVIPEITNAIKTGDWSEAGQAITDAITGLLGKITDALPGLSTMAATIIGTLVGALVTVIPEILPPLIEATILLLNTLIKVLADNGPMLISAGIDALMMLISGIVDSLPSLIDAGINIVMSLVGSLLDRLPELVTAALKIIVALAGGLVGALPKLIQEIPKIIEAIITAVISNLPMLLEAAVQILVALASALIQNIPLLITSIPKIMTAVFKAFRDIKWGDIGKSIMDGIGTGIKGAVTGLVNSVIEVGKKVVSGIKNFFGINSPSKMFETEVGLQLGAGMAKGIANSASQVNAAMAGLNKKLAADATINANVTGGISSYGSGNIVMVNVPLTLDGQVITTATSRIQQGKNRTRARALGVMA